jgi:hypothetical protein
VVFATVMMLAFLVDQTQQLCCALFQAVWAKLGSKRLLWERMRHEDSIGSAQAKNACRWAHRGLSTPDRIGLS